MVPQPALPRQHVSRARLVRELVSSPVALIEAGGGFGKSVLATEFRHELSIASAVAELERDTDEPEQLVGALRRGMRRGGLSDLASALAGAGDADPAEVLDLAQEPVLIVVEEVQHASGDAAGLLARLARGLEARHRMLLVGRRLDPQLTELRSAIGALLLDAEALAFDDPELRALLAGVLEREPGPEEVEEVRRLAAGWPAASALAATWLARRSPDTPAAAMANPLAGLLDELLAGLDSEGRERIARLGHLPLLSDAVADACAGPGALALLIEAGLPLRAGRPGWVELPDPIRDELAERAPLPAEVARGTAEAYAEAGQLDTGLALLARVADHEGIAALLAARRWQELGALELAELRAILSTLPSDALEAHPFALVQVARLAEQLVELEYRIELLDRALELTSEPRERREIEAELAATHAVLDPGEEVERRAGAILGAVGGDEAKVRARALTALGRVEAWRGDPTSMLNAERRLAEAAALCRMAQETEWEARTLTGLGYRVAFARGELELAVTHMTDALTLLPEPGRERAAAATFLADVLAYVGRLDDAAAALGEAAAIGRKLGDHRVLAYAAWTGVTLASLQGDAASTVQRIRTAELHPGDWYEHPTGVEFLGDAALGLARAGAREQAEDYARRAGERGEAFGHPEIAWLAQGAVAARWGDPAEAEEVLVRFALSPQQAPRDGWRTLLFRALAADRREDPGAADLAAQAYEAAGELGRPDLPALHEPDVAAVAGPLAAGAGSRTAAAVAEQDRSHVVTLLGGFGVAAGGRAVEPPAGRPSSLIKILALASDPVAADEAIELLWPGTDDQTGRRRLRNLLNRLRTSCGELVRREGEALVLAPDTEVDARRFEEAAAAATSANEARPGLARTALARYTGELLPADRYEPWATVSRERLRRRYLELLDLLVDDAVDRGDVDEAIRLLDRAQEAEPLDEDRYVRAAELLLFQGRRGSAQSLVDRAIAVRAELGLEPSQRLARLRAATGGD